MLSFRTIALKMTSYGQKERRLFEARNILYMVLGNFFIFLFIGSPGACLKVINSISVTLSSARIYVFIDDDDK